MAAASTDPKPAASDPRTPATVVCVTGEDRREARRIRQEDHSFSEPAEVEWIYLPTRILWQALQSPESQALDQIHEVARIPAGQTLLTPQERIRALTAMVERIGNTAAERAPQEEGRRPVLTEEAGIA